MEQGAFNSYNKTGSPYEAHMRIALKGSQADRAKLTAGLTGIPCPWPTINDATGGIQPGDYWLIVGEPAPRPRVWLNVLYGLVVVGFVVLAVWLAVGRG